jgi:hypothetical protein
MTRVHNTANDSGDFNLNIGDNNSWARDQMQVALLADIRRELRKLNTLMHCHNTQGIPRTLNRIDGRLAKNMPLRDRKGGSR